MNAADIIAAFGSVCFQLRALIASPPSLVLQRNSAEQSMRLGGLIMRRVKTDW
jgi:hypothetical protein